MGTKHHSPEHLAALRQTYGGPMSDQEVEFLRDVQGFIDYAIRNGLSFALVMGTLSHDINAIARYGFSVAEALADFEPKVAGYAASHADAVGEPEETDE